ncbi:MAG: hypothetical protein Q7V53_00215 [Caldisericota bacterium]|nr:hypothetical protein [Caldisericota bacterium]
MRYPLVALRQDRAGVHSSRAMSGVLRRAVCIVVLVSLLSALLPPFATPKAASSWARTYRGSSNSGRGKGTVLLPDGDIIVTGTQGGGLLVTRLSPEGDVRWSSTYDTGSTNSDEVISAIICSPSGLLVFRGRLIMRLNDSGTVRWARTYTVSQPSDALRVTEFKGAVQLPDGGYAVCGSTYSGAFLCRLDRNGSVVWAKAYPFSRYDRARIFSVPGGGFLLGATGPTEEQTGTQTVKLLWLNADGKVLRSLAYEDTTSPTSSYGFMKNMNMTSTGPVLLQWQYASGCFGTTVIKLDMTGAVQWTTWVGGLRKGNAEAGTSAIEEAPDGSLFVTGATTEFSEHDDWGYDGLAMKLSASGDVTWMSTIDREAIVASHYSGDIAATDDGGLVWAGTSNKEKDFWDMFVVRMGPDGTAGKLGVYLTQVDIGNSKLVRIEHPVVTATPSTRTSQAITCEVKDVQLEPTDAGLTGTELEGMKLAKLTLVPLYPADPATPSSIMQGGTMYRYYTVLDTEGETVTGAELRYYNPFTDRTVTATSDEHGEIAFSFVVPRNEAPKHWDSTLTIDRVRVGGLRSVLSSKPDFATDVLPLSWSTNWMMGLGIAGKAGLGIGAGAFGAVQQAGGMVLTRTEADPAWDGKGSMLVTDSMNAEAAIGVQGDVGKFRLGTVQAKAADASARVSLGTFIDFATLFNKPSDCSITQKLMAALALLLGVSQVASAGVTTIMGVAQSAIAAALSSDIEMEHITGGLSLGISGDVSALALELAKKGKTPAGTDSVNSLSGVSLGKVGVGEKILLSITGYPGAGEVSGKAAVQVSASFSVLEALGYSVVGWSSANSISAEVVVDPLNISFERFVTTMSVPPDDSGEAQETRLTVDSAVLGATADAAARVARQFLPLTPAGTPTGDQRIVLSKEFGGELLRSVVNAVSSIAIPYEHVVTQDKTPTSIEVGLGVSILGNEVDLALKPTWGRYQSYPLERGLFVPVDKELRIGRMVKLESYPATLFSAQVDTLGSVVVELLKVVGDLLSKVWDIATGWLSSAGSTILSAGAGLGSAIGGGVTTVFEKGTDILLSPFTVKPGAFPVFVAASTTRKVTLIGTPSTEGSFAIGGTYLLEPENGTLSKPAALTISCTPAAMGKRDPKSLSIYRYDPVGRVWSPLATKYDSTKQTFSAQITQMGGYCVGGDTEPPTVELLLPSGTPAVATSPTPQLTVLCRDAGSGVVPASLIFSLNGQPLTATWSPSAQTATMFVTEPLEEGEHALQVRAVDGNGNVTTASLPFDIRQKPDGPTLTLDGVSASKVDLRFAGTGERPVATFALWRSEPSVGPVYQRIANVASATASYRDADVRAGASYQYMVTGLTAQGIEGPPSDVLQVTVPGKPDAQGDDDPGSTASPILLWLLLGVAAVLAILVSIVVTRIAAKRRMR